ncbi:MAG: NUDIX domain-containing protein [Candidatus Nitrosopumilus limneticus]|nr:NUDIX hydrolase [Candidatus Nitrosopumilus limneticus]MDA0669115.1 NUDIX domain-containing protein [Thermoproteota archaeon]MSS85850.1 NUDIX domain-containing protein [Nitrosopumilus sp.]PHY04471.1 MAG: NUDIX hydrolase [Nitrososphaerota archaeon]MDA0853825.1 NUDIX domain-containing protein [Thermoproteota archaeon]
MRSTRIVTSFIKNNNKILVLKRSNKVKTMKGLWSGVSGIIENNEKPLDRAIIEIYEELGIQKDKIIILKSKENIKISSPQYENHEWEVFSYLFETKETKIKLNWENSEFRWISANELKNYETVPNLNQILINLL